MVPDVETFDESVVTPVTARVFDSVVLPVTAIVLLNVTLPVKDAVFEAVIAALTATVVALTVSF
jgi:hypothetical protein